MRDLGTIASDPTESTSATAIDGNIVVGYSTYSGGRGFVYQLPGGPMRNLGTLPGGMSSYASAVSGNVVAGYSQTYSHAVGDIVQHASAWIVD